MAITRGEYLWSLNYRCKWAWHRRDGQQASGAYDSYDDSTEAFEAHGFREAAATEVTFRTHPEFARMESLYGRQNKSQLTQAIVTLSRDIHSHQSAARREFNGNGGRRSGAAVSAQSARDLGQEKLLLQMYVSDKFGS